MKEPRTIEGQWWISSQPQEPQIGTLKFEPEDGLTLTVRFARQPGNDFAPFLSLGEKKCPRVIHGLDENLHPVTLFGCSVGESSANLGSKRLSILATAALTGAKVEAWSEARFRAVCLNFSDLHSWTNRRLYESHEVPSQKASFGLNLPDDLIGDLPGGVKWRLSPSFSSHTSLSELSFSFNHFIYLHFPEPVSAQALTDCWIQTFHHLLSLLMGGDIFIDECEFFEHDPFDPNPAAPPVGIELIRACEGITEVRGNRSGYHMVTRFEDILPQLPAIVKKWFEIHERIEPVVDLFMLVHGNRAPNAEIRFLLLAQALEALHSRSADFKANELPRADHRARVDNLVACVPLAQQEWLREKLAFSNQKTLAARLSDIFALHAAEVTSLTAGIPDFADKVKNTRNYYTHYGEELMEKGKVATGLELLRIMFALEAILGVCLLKEIGIEGEAIARFLRRYTSAEFIQLEDTSHADQPPTLEPQSVCATPAE